VAGRLVVPRKTVLDWLRTGALKAVKAGRLWRIREPDVLAFLREPERPEETRP
jgi:excisionase family DNA binding protein